MTHNDNKLNKTDYKNNAVRPIEERMTEIAGFLASKAKRVTCPESQFKLKSAWERTGFNREEPGKGGANNKLEAKCCRSGQPHKHKIQRCIAPLLMFAGMRKRTLARSCFEPFPFRLSMMLTKNDYRSPFVLVCKVGQSFAAGQAVWLSRHPVLRKRKMETDLWQSVSLIAVRETIRYSTRKQSNILKFRRLVGNVDTVFVWVVSEANFTSGFLYQVIRGGNLVELGNKVLLPLSQVYF